MHASFWRILRIVLWSVGSGVRAHSFSGQGLCEFLGFGGFDHVPGFCFNEFG
ncbi:hypothetical protein M758_UG200400 [Ceratodon purpureus]|nr:hypothetical protein M758_UG200400 [Ceratodon purpureus]